MLFFNSPIPFFKSAHEYKHLCSVYYIFLSLRHGYKINFHVNILSGHPVVNVTVFTSLSFLICVSVKGDGGHRV
jgi:hypothetical protein